MRVVEHELWEVLVPAESGSEEIPVEHHQEWDGMVREVTGGLTIMRTAHGQWVDESGNLFKERMIPVRLACSREQIEQVMDLTLTHYGQLAVMAYRISEQALILESTET